MVRTSGWYSTVFGDDDCAALLVGEGEWGSRSHGGDVLNGLDFGVRSSASWETTAGGGWDITDCRERDGSTWSLEEDLVGLSDISGGRHSSCERGAGVCSRLSPRGQAGMFVGPGDDVADDLSVAGPRLALTSAPEVAAACDKGEGDEDGHDGGEPGREGCPMNVNE